ITIIPFVLPLVAIPLLALLAVKGRIFSYLFVDDLGIRITYLGKTKKHINWDEIKAIKIIGHTEYSHYSNFKENFFKEKHMRYPFSILKGGFKYKYSVEGSAKFKDYLIFAKEQIYLTPDQNLINNFCIGKRDKKLHSFIMLNIDKTALEQKDKDLIKEWVDNSAVQ
ncbi:MAG: hypothetical protein FWD86_03170, partial [Firmicutes bacterium]|nr:hypothetical protein [Bacillota bacterium]